MLRRPTKRAKPGKETKQSMKETKQKAKKEVASKKSNNNNDHSDFQCTGEMCSKHGVNFVVCLTQCVPVDSVSLTMVARDCVFANKDIAEMTQSEKRFLLYYYYATTVYQFHGKGNRVELLEYITYTTRPIQHSNIEVLRWPSRICFIL